MTKGAGDGMDIRLREALEDRVPGEYILPFLWQHGEEHALLSEELDAMEGCGIREFCAESRVHEQFCRDAWWEDFGFLLEEARRRGMRVWLLDDKRFPTGYANNYIAAHPELRAVRARLELRDFVGPRKDAALVPHVLREEGERLIAAVAYRRAEDGDGVVGEGVPLLSRMEDGLIWWDIPEGEWRVFYVVRTRVSPVAGKANYIDMLSAESCAAMIRAVYEPHYAHFKQYFGNTFAGFFSDEPGFANEGGTYRSTLGREAAVIPWSDALPELLAERMGCDSCRVLDLLPALWCDLGSGTAALRESYMEAITEAFSRNFSWQLGDWCRAHGVAYIGHVIEDENAHQRLGHGCGHYFRALDGQDMGGIDIVLHQFIPGMAERPHAACLEERRADPAFYRYTLPRLASSHAHIQPLKQGRSICEIYGGFGWAEGVPEMKQMTDLMLSGGINHFVPHAFTAKYPDPDHPPHFYARGMNQQYPAFRELMAYARRLCHALSGGIHRADVAVYYNAEAEWSGGKCQMLQEVCKALTRGQVEFDILPRDCVRDIRRVERGQIEVNAVRYGALIVPYSQLLPGKLLEQFEALAGRGLPVWFADGYPDASSEEEAYLPRRCEAVPLTGLVEALDERGLKAIRTDAPCPSLHCFHTQHEDGDALMLWNESATGEIDTWLRVPSAGEAVLYDAWNNRAYAAERRDGAVRVRLAPAQSIALFLGDCGETFPAYDYRDGERKPLNLRWTISTRVAGTDAFRPFGQADVLENLARRLPNFGGAIRYESALAIDDPSGVHALEFEEVGEVARLWVNDRYVGSAVSRPYRFELTGLLRPGENRLQVDVLNNPAYRERDFLSSYLPLPITGLRGRVWIE